MAEIDLLKELYRRAQSLNFNDHREADDIKRKGKMALENLFPFKMYSLEISNVRLKGTFYTTNSSQAERDDWTKGRNAIANILDTAIKDYEFQLNKRIQERARQAVQLKVPEVIVKEKIVEVVDDEEIERLNGVIEGINADFASYKMSVKRWVTFGAIALALNSIIWTIYIWSPWEWYATHQRKIGITLMMSLTVVLFTLNIPLKKKGLWISAAVAALISLLTMI